MTGLSDILNIDLTKYNDETLTAYYDKLDEYRKEIERILRHRKNVEKFDKMTNKEKADFINISLDMMDDFPKDYRLTEEHFKNGSFYGIKLKILLEDLRELLVMRESDIFLVLQLQFVMRVNTI